MISAGVPVGDERELLPQLRVRELIAGFVLVMGGHLMTAIVVGSLMAGVLLLIKDSAFSNEYFPHCMAIAFLCCVPAGWRDARGLALRRAVRESLPVLAKLRGLETVEVAWGPDMLFLYDRVNRDAYRMRLTLEQIQLTAAAVKVPVWNLWLDAYRHMLGWTHEHVRVLNLYEQVASLNARIQALNDQLVAVEPVRPAVVA